MPAFTPPEPVEVEDLGLASSDAVWLGLPAQQQQLAQARRAGLVDGVGDDVVTLTAGAIASADALRRFVAVSDEVAGDVVGALAGPCGAWSDEPAFGPPARMVRLRGGGALTAARLELESVVVVPVEHRSFPLALAEGAGGRTVELALSDAVLVGLGHWSGVLWANLLSLGPGLWRELIGPAWALPARVAWAAVRALSVDRYRLAGALSRVHRSARVHPTAVVEASWVGPDAEVGPGAVVRGAWLAAGARVEANALAAFAVIGPGAVVQRHGWLQYAVLHAGAAVGGAMQLGVLGPGASLKGGGYLMDQALVGAVHARVRGQRVPVPLGMLGVGLGARSVVASGVWVAPGRSVPPDVALVPESGVWTGGRSSPGVRTVPRELS